MNDALINKADLPIDYYLKNFQFLVDWVINRYQDLLGIEELQFISAFQQLEKNSQCLLVRMSSRKGPLFRRNKLNYIEIESIDHSAKVLIDVGLLFSDRAISLSELTNVLTKAELLLLFDQPLKGMKQKLKEELVQILEAQFPQKKSWAEWTQNTLDNAYYLDNQPIIRTLLLLFFGNTHQDLTEFVLQDLGLFRYENYIIDSQHRIFKRRDELERYQQLIYLQEQLEQSITVEELIHIADQLPTICSNEKLKRLHARLCNQLAYKLERSNQHLLAIQLYAQSHLSPARERRIRLLEKQGNYPEAWTLLNELIHEPRGEQELQVAQRIAPRLAKKLGEIINKKSPSSTLQKQLTLPRLIDSEGSFLRVEEIVRQSLHTPDTPCVYAENLLLTGLFGLWLWPEIFRGIDGAFANPFQAAPLDMYQENFVANRPGINDLWNLFETDEYVQHINSMWDDKFGITNHFVHWSFLDKELIELALHSIPAVDLKRIFERLLFDIKSNRSGLPDLIQFYPNKKYYRLIEVKGPGDRIQDNQQRWLDYFSMHNIPAEVCYVNWA